MMDKSTLRATLRKKRRQLSVSEFHAHSHSAMTYFIRSDAFRKNDHFACYLAQDNEVATQLFIENIFLHKKKCYLPHLEKNHMQFAQYKLGDALKKNQFGILEPDVTQRNFRDVKQMDVILTPLVGFDDTGARLGMGGGFYDRTLSTIPTDEAQRPLIIGLAFECQKAERVPCDPWDIALDAILTEKGLRFFD